MQRVKQLHSQPPDKGFLKCDKPPMPVSWQAAKSSLGRCKRAERPSSLSGLYSLWLSILGRAEPHSHKTISPTKSSCTHLHTTKWRLSQIRQNCFTGSFWLPEGGGTKNIQNTHSPPLSIHGSGTPKTQEGKGHPPPQEITGIFHGPGYSAAQRS